MVKQADAVNKGQIQQGSELELDAQYHEIGIPAVNAAARAMRREIAALDTTVALQGVHRVGATGWLKTAAMTNPWAEQQAIGTHR